MAIELTLEWAEKYVKLGWSLIPIAPKAKEPLIPWKQYQSQRASIDQIKDWICKWPDMNLGVVTGEISGIVVVDLDGPMGKDFGLKNQIVSSVSQFTGNGLQRIYKWTEHVDNSASKIAPGVDIRGDGGFIVVGPSVHPNGKRYRWERFCPTGLTSLPNIMPQSVSAPSTKESSWISKALEEMKIGNIDDTLVSVLGRMRRDGWTDSDARTLLAPHAERAGATSGHLDDKIRNIWNRYEPKTLFNGVPKESGGLSIHTPGDDVSYGKFTESMLHNGHERSGLQTGFATIDKYFQGGLKSERLFTVAARTGTGKTNFAIALASNLCQQGKKVLYFSTEFSYEKIWSRYMATLRNPGEFRSHPFHVCDSFSPRIEQVEEAIKKVMPDVYIFDHINHIGEERESLGAFMQGCNFLQRTYNCQGVMVAQLNRQADWVEEGKRIEPRMSMIKGSGTIEQASSRVLLLSEVKVTPEYNEIIGVLDKNDSGDRGLINFGLYKDPYIFREIA